MSVKTKEYYGIGNDEYGYYKTVDNGRTWSFFRDGSGPIVEKDNEIVEDTSMEEEERRDRGGGGGNVYFDIEDLLLDILNNIILPKLSYMLSGKKDILLLENGKIDNNVNFFTNSELYKTTFNGIDFAVDVGMKPLSIEELKEYEEIKDIERELYESMDTEKDIKEIELNEKLEKNKYLKTTFNIIDLKLNRFREIILEHEVKKIENAEESYEGVPKENIPTVKSFYDIRKGSEQSIVGTIINSIFTFNNCKKLSLLKQSIMEVAINLKERINYRISTLTSLVESGSYNRDKLFKDEKFLNLFKFNLKEEWTNALNRAIKKYYSQAIDNIYKISDSDDKDLISIAANKYHEYRQKMLDIASNIINNMKYDVTRDISINKYIESTNVNIDKFYNDVQLVVKSSKSSIEIMDILKEYKSKEKERLSKLDIVYYNDINSLLLYIINELNANINVNSDNKINDTFFFNEQDSEDFKSLSPLEINRVYGYYIDIVNEFKNRCTKVLSISTDKIIDEYKNNTLKVSNRLDLWVNRLLRSDDFEAFVEQNDLELIKEDNKDACYSFNKVIRTIWKGLRSSI